jgi:hypothetical protein
MTPRLERIEMVGQGIDEARARIMATRESLQATLDLHETDDSDISRAIARFGRVEAEPTRIEGGIMARGLGFMAARPSSQNDGLPQS